MVNPVLMTRGAHKVLASCGGAEAGESILIITDFSTEEFARPLVSAALNLDSEPISVSMEPRSRDGQEPPGVVTRAMEEADLFVALVSKSITHTRAVKNAVGRESRGLMMTQFAPEMLIKGGIEADFPSIAPACNEMARAFEEGSQVRLTTGDGACRLTASIEGRRGNALTGIVRPGEFALIPTVEANVSPVEGSAEGSVFVDGSVPYEGIGLLTNPIVASISRGYVSNLEGGSQADRLESLLEAKDDKEVYNVAEIGVGMNPFCRLCGLMLEDEGVYGSVHIGIGTSITLGGSVVASCHYDLITLRPTLEIDGKVVISEGDIIL